MALNDSDEFSVHMEEETSWPDNHAELGAAADEPYHAEIGSAANEPYLAEIGSAANEPYLAEIGSAANEPYLAEIGSRANEPYQAEIGSAANEPYAPEAPILGSRANEPYQAEIGEVVLKVIEKARDNRSPPPRMRAVAVDAPLPDFDDDFSLIGCCIGEAQATGNPDPYPLLAKLLQRAGAGMPPRIVQVDSEQGYQKLCAAQAPEVAQLQTQVKDLSQRFAVHAADPEAHAVLREEMDDLTAIGAQLQA